MDWKQTVKDVAPTLGGLLATFGGPAGALAGAGITAIANALGVPASGDPTKDEAAVAALVQQGLTPEQRAALVQADLDYKKATLAATTRKQELDADVEKAYISDTDAARHAHAQNMGVMRLGYLINVASYVTVFAVLYGCFQLMNGTKLQVDPGIAATIGAVVGGVVQWLMANAAQANGFFFGSSPGSRELSSQLGKAVNGAVQQQPKR